MSHRKNTDACGVVNHAEWRLPLRPDVVLVAGLGGSAWHHTAGLRNPHGAHVVTYGLHQHPFSHLHHMAGNHLLLCCCELGSTRLKKSNLERRKIIALLQIFL